MKTLIKLTSVIIVVGFLLLPIQPVHAMSIIEGPIFGENFRLSSGETLNEDLVVIGGSVSIEKNAIVNGSIVLFGGSLTLDGDVSKDVVVLGGAVKLGPETHVKGNLVTFGAVVSRDQGARVDGDVINNPSRPEIPVISTTPPVVKSSTGTMANLLTLIGQSIMLALLSMLITMFLPIHMRRVADGVVSQPLVSFGMGLLTLIAFIVGLVALALFSLFIITLLITIPLIGIVTIIFAAAVVLGWLAIGLEVGIRISQMFKREWPLPLAAGLGVFCLNLVAQGVGFIPCIGGLISAIVGFAGLGAVLITRFGTRIQLAPWVSDLPSEE